MFSPLKNKKKKRRKGKRKGGSNVLNKYS